MQELVKQTLITCRHPPYKCYRIPCIVATAKGTIVTSFETRLSPADEDARGIGMMRSMDEGRTWSPMQVLVSTDADQPLSSPVMVASRNGEVHFLYQLDGTRIFHCRSTDDAESFSEPVEISSCFERLRDETEFNLVFWTVGPGRGIELSDGTLLVPGYVVRDGAGSLTCTLVSEDAGENWRVGALVLPENMAHSVGEPCAAELDNGAVMINMRNNISIDGSSLYRAVSVSDKGGANFPPATLDRNLPDPSCRAGMGGIRHPGLHGGGILFLGCNNTPCEENGCNHARTNLTLRLSTDNGKTWKYSRYLEVVAGYADVTCSPDGRWVYCFYEQGKQIYEHGIWGVKELVFARANLEWLTDGEIESNVDAGRS